MKSLSNENGFGYLLPRCILFSLVHPGGNVESLIFREEFLNFTLIQNITESSSNETKTQEHFIVIKTLRQVLW